MELMPEVRMDLLDDEEPFDEEPFDDIGEKEESLGPSIVEAQILEEDIFEQASSPQETPEVIPKKPRKKRKPMTEAQKASLAKARVKALETRRRKAMERKELQELTKLKEQKDLKKLKEYVSEEPQGAVESPVTATAKTISKDDLEDAQLQAIMKYDALRKKEKKIKKENAAKQAQEDKVKQRIRNAIEPQRQFEYGQSGYFDNCF